MVATNFEQVARLTKGDDEVTVTKGLGDKVYVETPVNRGTDILKFGTEYTTGAFSYSQAENSKDLVITYKEGETTQQTITVRNYFTNNKGTASRSSVKQIQIGDTPAQNLSDLYHYTNVMGNKRSAAGTMFSDDITGSDKADRITTGKGNDTITAGLGNDTITINGAGNKTINIATADGDDVIRGIATKDAKANVVFTDMVTGKTGDEDWQNHDLSYSRNGNDLIVTRSYETQDAGYTYDWDVAIAAGKATEEQAGAKDADGEFPSNDATLTINLTDNDKVKPDATVYKKDGQYYADAAKVATVADKGNELVEDAANANYYTNGTDVITKADYDKLENKEGYNGIKTGTHNDTWSITVYTYKDGDKDVYTTHAEVAAAGMKATADDIAKLYTYERETADGDVETVYTTDKSYTVNGVQTYTDNEQNVTVKDYFRKDNSGKLTINGNSISDVVVDVIARGNRLTGGAENNTLVSSESNETLAGGAGKNVFDFTQTAEGIGKDTVVSTGDDTLVFDQGAVKDYAKAKNGRDLVITLNDTEEHKKQQVTVKNAYTQKTNITINEVDEEGAVKSSKTLAEILGVQNAGTADAKKAQRLNGTVLDDNFTLGTKNDVVTTGAGNDTITTGAGKATINITGDGNKTVNFSSETGNTTIKGIANATKLTFADTTDAAKYDVATVYSKNGNDLVISNTYTAKAVETVTTPEAPKALGDEAAPAAPETPETKTVTTTVKDYFKDAKNADKLAGITGFDNLTITGKGKITGSFANDTITGSAKADKITTGAGKDVITAGAGNDTITIDGAGTKTINIANTDGNDVIYGVGTKDAKTRIKFTDIKKDDISDALSYARNGKDLVITREYQDKEQTKNSRGQLLYEDPRSLDSDNVISTTKATTSVSVADYADAKSGDEDAEYTLYSYEKDGKTVYTTKKAVEGQELTKADAYYTEYVKADDLNEIANLKDLTVVDIKNENDEDGGGVLFFLDNTQKVEEKNLPYYATHQNTTTVKDYFKDNTLTNVNDVKVNGENIDLTGVTWTGSSKNDTYTVGSLADSVTINDKGGRDTLNFTGAKAENLRYVFDVNANGKASGDMLFTNNAGLNAVFDYDNPNVEVNNGVVAENYFGKGKIETIQVAGKDVSADATIKAISNDVGNFLKANGYNKASDLLVAAKEAANDTNDDGDLSPAAQATQDKADALKEVYKSGKNEYTFGTSKNYGKTTDAAVAAASKVVKGDVYQYTTTTPAAEEGGKPTTTTTYTQNVTNVKYYVTADIAAKEGATSATIDGHAIKAGSHRFNLAQYDVPGIESLKGNYMWASDYSYKLTQDGKTSNVHIFLDNSDFGKEGAIDFDGVSISNIKVYKQIGNDKAVEITDDYKKAIADAKDYSYNAGLTDDKVVKVAGNYVEATKAEGTFYKNGSSLTTNPEDVVTAKYSTQKVTDMRGNDVYTVDKTFDFAKDNLVISDMQGDNDVLNLADTADKYTVLFDIKAKGADDKEGTNYVGKALYAIGKDQTDLKHGIQMTGIDTVNAAKDGSYAAVTATDEVVSSVQSWLASTEGGKKAYGSVADALADKHVDVQSLIAAYAPKAAQG